MTPDEIAKRLDAAQSREEAVAIISSALRSQAQEIAGLKAERDEEEVHATKLEEELDVARTALAYVEKSAEEHIAGLKAERDAAQGNADTNYAKWWAEHQTVAAQAKRIGEQAARIADLERERDGRA